MPDDYCYLVCYNYLGYHDYIYPICHNYHHPNYCPDYDHHPLQHFTLPDDHSNYYYRCPNYQHYRYYCPDYHRPDYHCLD